MEREREYAQQRIDDLKEEQFREEQKAREYQSLIQAENLKSIEINAKKLHLSTHDRKKLKTVCLIKFYLFYRCQKRKGRSF